MVQIPADEMQSLNSSEKHFSTETSKEGGSQSVLTKMSSTITQSSSSHSSSLKEFSSSTTSSSTAPGQAPTSVCVKSTKQSSEHSTSENGGPPVVQVSFINVFNSRSVYSRVSVSIHSPTRSKNSNEYSRTNLVKYDKRKR